MIERNQIAGAVAPARARVLVAFALVYVVWGSTYLAIRYAVATLPPFLMAGSRFLLAGSALYTWARLRGAAPPSGANWRATAIIGGLLLLGGNGSVVWAEQRVPSGLAALLVATVPLWMVVMEAIRRRTRPGLPVVAGVLLGLAGLAILVGPDQLAGSRRPDPLGAAVLGLASLSWAVGSLYSRHAPLPAAPLLGTAMEMLCGGALLVVAGLATDEAGQLAVAHVAPSSLWALGYLIVFGSLVGFTAYTWLLRVSTPARVSTYAYVNPVVAVLLGWAIGGEALGARTLLAAAVIVAGVVLITMHKVAVEPAD
ncbi:MAG TPA: drug/metabolite exporter YedA [Polyangia bacterium]|nr:drug/metabolite exporter YedA [Polyangia bacterium]